jgi:hypothetical protein
MKSSHELREKINVEKKMDERKDSFVAAIDATRFVTLRLVRTERI